MVTPLDAEVEPASLVALRGGVERLLPEVEIADLPLEVHGWTGFLDEYTHISGTDTREVHLPESLSALLVSESCNVERLNWVGHNYLRSATHAAANVRLVDFHTPLPLAQAWGGGEMASADGMRFVIPCPPSTPPTTPATSAGNAAPRCIRRRARGGMRRPRAPRRTPVHVCERDLAPYHGDPTDGERVKKPALRASYEENEGSPAQSLPSWARRNSRVLSSGRTNSMTG